MYTLTIIKPDAFDAGKAGQILAHLEAAGFAVRAARRRKRKRSTRFIGNGHSFGRSSPS
jgi:nucleoside diphosphate kinase